MQRLDVMLLFSIITGITIWMHRKDFSNVSLAWILVSTPAETVNGICEEALWCELYNKLFPGNWLSVLLLPSIGFALWHITPPS